jgi:hypothetical protein
VTGQPLPGPCSRTIPPPSTSQYKTGSPSSPRLPRPGPETPSPCA